MAAYKLFNGQTIEADYIYYIDPTNGDNANDGLTESTALKTPSGANSKQGGNRSILVFVAGEHTINITAAADVKYFYCSRAAGYTVYFVSNPKKTKLLFNPTVDIPIGHAYYVVKSAYTIKMVFIGINFEAVGDKTFAGFSGYTENSSIGYSAIEVYNCYFKIPSYPNTTSSKPFFYAMGNTSKLYDSVFENLTYGITLYSNGDLVFQAENCFFYGGLDSEYGTSPLILTNCISNTASNTPSVTSDTSLSLDNKRKMLSDEVLITPQTRGVYSGTYSWELFLTRSNFYLRDAGGVYYRINEERTALETVETLAEEDGLEDNLSPAVMELIRALNTPQIVGFNVDTIAYKAVHLDDMQLMIPTGDIDLSLASKVNGFVFNDVGDVRRLLSVDNGATWRCFDGSEFIEFEGDITDKEAVYAVANDTDALNSLTAEQIAEIIPPANVDKHIRFLTILKQAALADDTKTLSVGINNERRGYFKSISAANFEETLFTGSLQVKYIGADNISELHLLLAV